MKRSRPTQLRLCIFSSMHSPLAGRLFNREALTLVRRHDTTIIGPYDKRRDHREGVRIVGLPNRRDVMGRAVNLVRLLMWAFRTRMDYLICMELDSLSVALIVRLFHRVKVVFDCHEYYPESVAEFFPEYLRRPVYVAVWVIEQILGRSADWVIAVNEDMGRKFRRMNGNTVVLPNYPRRGWCERGRQYRPDNEAGRESTPTLIYIGGVSEPRGITRCVEMLAQVKEEIPSVKFVCVGGFSTPAYERELHRLVKSLDLTQNVEFRGKIPHDEVPSYLRRADVGVFLLQPVNKRYDWGEPIKYFEYSAAGLPVVMSDLPAKRRLIEKNGNGVVVDPLDPAEAARKVIHLLRHPEVRRVMGEAGRAAFEREYNWERLEPRLLNIFE